MPLNRFALGTPQSRDSGSVGSRRIFLARSMRRASRIPLSPEGERAFDPSYRHPQCIGDGEDVLVTAARDVDDDDLIFTIFACFGGERGQNMVAFERGDAGFGPAASLEGAIGRAHV